jgi:DNA-binding beta-propeller fold protein YncE
VTRLPAVLAFSLAFVPLVACGAGKSKEKSKTKPVAGAPIVVTSRMDGSVSIVERASLKVLRSIPSVTSTWPMLSVADPARETIYVGNFGGALARVSYRKGAPEVAPEALDVGGPTAGLALSPDGTLLAVNGVKDLSVRLVDLATWKEVARASLGTASDEPKHKPLTFGVASPHPVWLADGSALVTQDNVHEELVLVAKDGTVKTRRAMKSAVHTVMLASDGSLLALVEGDGAIKPQVVVLKADLEIVREIDVPLADDEAPKLHHGALSPDGELLVVANMGPVAAASGVTVVAVKWKTGEIAWSAPTIRTAGHVAFLAPDKVLVLGHRSSEMKLLDVKTGKELANWAVLGTASLGHALEVQADGTVLVLDGTLGRILRFKSGEMIAESERVGDGYAESSLAE